MHWALIIIVIFGGLLLLMATGIPVAFCFLAIILFAGALLWGGGAGLLQVVSGMVDSVNKFSFIPLPLFVLMGEVMFQSGIAPYMIDALDKWVGKLPGRLAILSVGAGVLFATLTGVSMASVVMLGRTLVPEMKQRGYKDAMIYGPILGAGGLAIMIPPSGLAVLMGALGEISIGKILMAIIIPGLVMAALYALYIILRCKFEPSLSPAYDVSTIPLAEKISGTVRYILPLALVIFLVIGVIFLGVATPTEAAATGAIGTFILAAFYKKLNWQLIKRSLDGTLRVTVMMLVILVCSSVFSQILAYSGAAEGLADFATGFKAHPILIIIAMQIVLLVLGMFMDVTSIMMVTIPIFIPIVNILDFDAVWFSTIYLINMEMASITPPFGLSLFAMKGVAPAGTSMKQIIRSSIPFLILNVLTMALIMIFPAIALWLPSIMGKA